MKRNFYSRFGQELSLEQGQEKFINRVNDSIFGVIKASPYTYHGYSYSGIVQHICDQLGLSIENYRKRDMIGDYFYYGINRITGNDFEMTLHVLEILVETSSRGNLELKIKDILNLSTENDNINLGIRFHGGLFYLAGDELLDAEIIETSLDNIEGFKASKDYEKVLKKYLSGDFHSTLSGCFTTIETLSQEILGNSKGFKANKLELLKYFGGSDAFSNQWQGNINLLYDYLNDYSERHNGDKRDEIDELEVEATLYQTGLIINLLVNKYRELGKQ